MSQGLPHTSATRTSRAFLIGIALNLVIVAGEAAGGWIGNSTALIADAGHNLTDVLSLILAGGALWLARRPSSEKRTYGFRRATILASLANAIFLVIVSVLLTWEGIARLLAPEQVNEPIVIAVAAVAAVANGFTAWLFVRDQSGDINVRGAFLHMASDAALSLGVVAAGIVIFFTGWSWLDPAMSLVIVAAIVAVTWGLLRESFDLSLDAVPTGIDTGAVQAYLQAQPGVCEVHHLHVWAMSTTEIALTAHLVKPDGGLDDALLARVERELAERFGIGHVALQLERGDADNPCDVAAPIQTLDRGSLPTRHHKK
ncbi:MAG: cation diffusion facilitator family transporter [Gammaproteobacteria bacterium]|nr:cation diffusion facilitator family transporter [Gammaproteobacteria bacterium]